jgi:hypothetical protein
MTMNGMKEKPQPATLSEVLEYQLAHNTPVSLKAPGVEGAFVPDLRKRGAKTGGRYASHKKG